MPEEHKRSPTIVILVSDYFPSRGGTSTQTRLHALELARRGWDVTVLTRRVRSRMGSSELEGIYVRRIALPGRGRLAKGLDLLLSWVWLARRRRSLDAVSVMMDADFALAACAAGLGRSTVVTWVTRGDATRLLGGRVGGFRRWMLRNCAQVVLTARMEDELHELGVPEVSIIPVPVDTARFRPPSDIEKADAVRDLKIDSGPIILFVGHLQERKGVDLLIRAFGQLLDAGLDAHLVIVGGPVETVDHRYVESLETIVREHGMDERVIFTGPKDDVAPYLSAADIFCLASHREGMPNVLLEAMACGLACVAPASAGGDELLYGSVGLIPASNSPADLAGALIPLLGDPDRRRALGTSAAARVRNHEPGRIIAAYEGLWPVGGAVPEGG
ncbi:MAG: glycosyltransferase family 4 protein [Acidimicrobiales bacterium]|jgi:glycosyltransferase involved in cell wall biosynthesis